ncbi:hypothetical protein [Cupriavidus numazuensis]|uniref:Uncharacterized protein n=1 Tax=Cupriavidus numazuensis TaxID=221992 RepID=A0ABM8T9G2_9BURK|nr:hypothetical protein [Cupriavidus numazuensis]CAG2129075.1 hypothetical protein LMG26411_00113 [Cupriavidus numazuensis]
MEFFDYYLKGLDRDTTRAGLLAAGLTVDVTDEDGEPRRVPAERVNLSTIGTVAVGGEWDAEGNMITAPVEVPGWHVNLRLDRPLSEAELAHIGDWVLDPAPATPVRVWA